MIREEERLGAALQFYDKHKTAASNVTLVDSFVYGAKWADRTMIDKACEWLENNFVCFLQGAKRGIYSNQFVTVDEMIDNFKQRMEE